MMYVHACSSFSRSVEAILDNLKPELKQACKKQFRRIDRFIQLALLGSGLCVKERVLPANTSLLLTSCNGALSNPIETLVQVFDQHHTPKPFNFINTLGNSACFYIAQSFDLNGSSSCMSRAECAFEAGLQLAAIELQDKGTDTVLLGAVDECPAPAHSQRYRLGVEPDTALAEASHWLLLSSHTDGSHLGSIDEVVEFFDWQEVIQWCSGQGALSGFGSPNLSQQQCDTLNIQRFRPAQGYNPVQSGEALVQLVMAKKNAIWLTATPDGSYIGVRLSFAIKD